MSYEEQRRQLRASLQSAGLGSESATQIANILCNGLQEMRHSGPVTHDSTPASMREVTPDVRRLELTNFDFLPGDPDYRKQRTPPSEDRPRPIQAPNVVSTVSPQQTDGSYRVSDGSLAEAQVHGDSVSVNVRSRVAKQPAGGLPITMLDKQTNTLVGKELKANAEDGEGRVKVLVLETGREVALNFQFQNLSRYEVITNVEYVPTKGLRLTYRTITAWDERLRKERWIRMQDVPVVTDVADDLLGTRLHVSKIPAFERNKASDIYFNNIRIGTFTGGWPKGGLKEITQAWPLGGAAVQVKNLTREIPDTDETKHVLFTVRTQDKKAVREVNGEDENPVLNEFPPVVENIAVEIANATEDCTAFHYLNGLLVADLAGYDAAAYQALSHGVGESTCLEWRGEPINVITGVGIVGSALVFATREAWILKAGDVGAISIPLTDCPPPSPPPPPPPATCSGSCTSGGDCASGCDCVDGVCVEAV